MKIRSSHINPEQVRLLLFKESDWSGRKLLFDSSTIEKVPAAKNDFPNIKQTSELPCIVEVSDGHTYMYKGPATDAKLLGEMIFGAVAMNYKGVSFKIHIMDDPKRLMCTKVFCVPTARRVSRMEKKYNDANSNGELRNSSKPLNVPSQRDEGVSLSFSLDRGDSGYCGELSPHSSVDSTNDYFSMFNVCDGKTSQDDLYSFRSPPGRKLSTSSNGSWHRRTFHNMATRFELGSSNSLCVPSYTATGSSSQIYSNSSTSGTNESLASTYSSVMTQRKNKLGLALLITFTESADVDLVRRCMEHSPQLQSLVCRLRMATLCAGAGAGSGFVATLHRAAVDAARWLTDLMYGPRLQPMWLSLVTSDPRTANKMADTMLSDFCSVLSIGDTKNTNFFISTLLTHVLTYHLGWVTTVSPYDVIEPQHCPTRGPQRPYNVLWAQLNDLCGSIGFPPRSAKTIISGAKNTPFINKLLVTLTYFLRCGDVKRTEFEQYKWALMDGKVFSVNESESELDRSTSDQAIYIDSLKVPSVNTRKSDSSVSTLVASEVSVKRSATLANLNEALSNDEPIGGGETSACSMRRNATTVLLPLSSSLQSSESSLSVESETDQKVVFVLGEDEKLVGIKNKSTGGKSVKKSSKLHSDSDEQKSCDPEKCYTPPSRCCSQTLQHSKPIKHSGFKFEFDKYPQIVTNYMKSKNLEILDRHYIGKPGNLKLDNFQFDPTVVPPIQEERCETCYKCQLMDSMLQTPTNASEFEYLNDVPRQQEPQYAKETIVEAVDIIDDVSPKTFVSQRKHSTVVVNVIKSPEDTSPIVSVEQQKVKTRRAKGVRGDELVNVKRVVEFPISSVSRARLKQSMHSGFDATLLGGITDHYVPDLILQGTIADPKNWENELRQDLELTSYLNKKFDLPTQTVAIVGDTNTWEVRVMSRGCAGCGGAGGMSALVGAMLDALPAMWRANVPAHQCLSFLESKLREFCVLSKTLADMLMAADFCDIETLTKSLNIDVNDVPFLLAVATTHTPQVATKYGVGRW